MLRVGLNPYGLTYTLGFQGAGTPRQNPAAGGLDAFVHIAHEIGARTIELDWRWLVPLAPEQRRGLGIRLRADDVAVVVSFWLAQKAEETLEQAIEVAIDVGAPLIRLHLTPVLEGARAAAGPRWDHMVAHARQVLVADAPKARGAGVRIGLENHQDFGSEELLSLADAAGDGVGVVFDTGNPFAVGEDPLAFARRVQGRVFHLHLKDYRAQFTAEGYRLVRCAIGDGCVPLEDIVATVADGDSDMTASLEPAALDARHVRLFTAAWWHGYPPRDASELGVALGRLRARALADSEDCRTPWERQASGAEIEAYERDHLDRSVAFARAVGWWS